MIHELREWAIYGDFVPYTAPEAQPRYLSGVCPERAIEVSRFGPDGADHRITTSRVVTYDPMSRVATTKSGSQYRLVGDPEPEYAAWCRSNGYDPAALFSQPKPLPPTEGVA